MATQLRPLTLGEILDRTAQIYRRNFLLFVGVAAVPTVIIVAFFVLAGGGVAAFAVGVRNQSSLAAIGIGVLIAILAVIAFCACMAAYVFSHAALTRTAASALKGQKLTIREALRSVRPRFWRYLWLMVLQGLIAAGIPGLIAAAIIGPLFFLISKGGGNPAASVLMGFVIFLVFACLLVACILIGLQVSMGMPVAVTEDKGAWESIQRSRQLSKGAKGRIFVLLLLIWALMFALSMIGYIPLLIVIAVVTATHSANATLLMGIAQVANVLLNYLLQTLVTPALLIGLVLVYFDQRVRLEGYDIEWMMEQAGLTPEASLTPESGPPATMQE